MELKNMEEITLNELIPEWVKRIQIIDTDGLYTTKTIYTEKNRPMSFEDVYVTTPACKNITIIAENEHTGVVFRFQRHNKTFKKIGETIGYT